MGWVQDAARHIQKVRAKKKMVFKNIKRVENICT